jgi:isoleucyl-tRNA synthetase
MRFDAVDKQPDFAALEERVLARWTERDVITQSLTASPDGPLLSCYDGPPTANGRPGVHHVEARVFKDIIPRYFSMKGYQVPRRAGWDCHGIPVELEVEKELGFTGKPQIEAYGVAEFNARCRASVTRYVEDWKKLTERIGYWVDMENAYWTMSTSYVESCWWSIKQIFDRGLLYQDYRVVPYCPRCGTALSDHEVAQGYARTEDLSLYFRLPLTTGPLAPGGEGVDGNPEGASLIAWTTVPWTIIFSTLAVVGENIRYVLARGGRAKKNLVVLAADRVQTVLGKGAKVIRDVALDEILGQHYAAPFNLIGPGSADDPEGDPKVWRFVVTGDFVTTDHGSGIVSTAPFYGEDDMKVARANHVVDKVPNEVDGAGRFTDRLGPYAGMYVRDANPQVVKDVAAAGMLIHEHMHAHTFPFCWRCRTPLIYYAKPSWYIGTTQFRDQLMASNATVDWRPDHIRDGRYGDWLANNVDWALSRERYWGTPLPLWRCGDCDHTIAIGSLADLSEHTGQDLSELDPHRPFVDEVGFACDQCEGGQMRRVPEVIDAWYDSGAMPFAQWGYPHAPGSEEKFDRFFPADYTAEAIDQTRGWWYSLHAIATIMFDENSYKRAMCLGHIVDSDGRKMSKSLGNVLDPWQLIGAYGADALRWLLLVEGNPWQSRRVGEENVRQVIRKLLLTIWNTYYFFVTYAELAGWTPESAAPPEKSRPIMDRYILAELADTVTEVDARLGDFDINRAGRRLAQFVDDLSNWYVRRSRDRFWSTGPTMTEDTESAFATLNTCLATMSGLLAPFMPFLADELYENLVRNGDPDAPDSVHLTRFPEPVADTVDDELRQAMALARRLVTLGRDARSSANVPVRRPLAKAVVTAPVSERHLIEPLREIIAAELNVKQLTIAAGEDAELVNYVVKPNFRALGAAFGNRTQQVAQAIRAIDPRETVETLRRDGSLTLDVEGEDVAITLDHLQVIEEPVTGWQISVDAGYSVAVDLELTTELRLEWLAREMVRGINELRKRQGLEVTDRVQLTVEVGDDPDGDIAATIAAHADRISADVLATMLTQDAVNADTGHRLELGEGWLLIDLRVVGMAAAER